MKIILLTLSFLLCISNAQAQLLELNWNCSPYDVSNCSPFVNVTTQCIPGTGTRDDWKVSHGSPRIETGTPAAGNGKWAKLDAHENNGVWTGEGLFIPYTFKKGRVYSIEISAQRTDALEGGRLRLKAAKELTAGGTSGCQEGTLPIIWDSEDIYVLGVAQKVSNYKKIFQAPDFEPTQDFNQFWMYAEEIYLGKNCEYLIEYVTITDRGPKGGGNTGTPTDCSYIPSTPTNLKMSITGNGELRLSWNSSSYHYGNDLIKYKIYYGTNTQSFTGTWNNTTHVYLPLLCSSTSYSVKAVTNIPNSSLACYSKRSELLTIESTLTLNTDLTPEKNKMAFATNSIRLTNGFRFTALSSDYAFSTTIRPCSSSSGRVSQDSVIYNDFSDEVEIVDLHPSDDDVIIYPNPSKGIVNIASSPRAEPSNYLVKVYATTGLQLFEQEVIGDWSKQTLDLSFLSKGVYIIRLMINNNVYVRQVILN